MDTRKVAVIIKQGSVNNDVKLLREAIIEILHLRSDTLQKPVESIEQIIKRKMR